MIMNNGGTALLCVGIFAAAIMAGGEDGVAAKRKSNTEASAPEFVLIPKSENGLEKKEFAVDHAYRIMKREVTIAQYCEFLNAVAKLDVHNIYDKRMRITRSGFPAKYSYKPKKGYADHPVTFINFLRAARFANWLHNGKPSGRQVKGVTEDGAYDLSGDLIRHSKNARFWIPTEKEWCKAAYYAPGKSKESGKPFYYDFGDKSLYKKNGYPKGEPPPGGAHSANYNKKLKDTTPVGAYSSAVSAYGLFDVNGNVFEWTETQRGRNDKNIRGGAWNYSGSYAVFSTRTGARLKEATAGYGMRLAAKTEQ